MKLFIQSFGLNILLNIMRKNTIITFDYEVFLGRETGTIENCVIKPTKSILKILEENNAKAIFFVDATWLLFLRDYSHSDFQAVSDQLKEIVNIGSSVELHLHPQWLHAIKIGDKIEFKSFENYRLHSLSKEDILDLFRRSIELLESITLQKIRCFRAGGYCIEPFYQLKVAFETYNIKYDFSVAPGISLKEGKVFDFDFSSAPELPFYNFRDNVIKHENNGCFIEVPISTYISNPIFRIINKLMLILEKDRISGDGVGLKETPFFSYKYFRKQVKFSKAMLTLDKTWNPFFKYLLVSHFRRKSLLVIISHTKANSRQSIENLIFATKKYNTLNSNDLDRFLS